MVVADNSEVIRLQKDLDEERQRVTSLQMELQMTKMEVKVQQKLIMELQQQISTAHLASANQRIQSRIGMFKMFLEKNIEICRQPGCRVMAFGRKRRLLLASQKSSTQGMFAGYGVRFLDLPTFRPNHYVFVSQQSIFDIAFDKDEELFVAATGEKTCRLYNANSRGSVEQFTPADSAMHACSFDQSRPKILYLGAQNSVFAYDIRNPRNFVREYKTGSDMSRVVNVVSVPPSEQLPFGGFLVCKLISCWFFEYTATGDEVLSSKLNIGGPFVSMKFDSQIKNALISTRSSEANPARHILADIVKPSPNMCDFQVKYFKFIFLLI